MTTKELYDTLISKPNLHALPKLYDNNIIWHLYKNAHIRAYCNNGDTVIEILAAMGFPALFCVGVPTRMK